ncbi:MAG: histidine kinase [Ferruginibacter sp.]|nr:histidine kinase [Ferruginibacter sp.]
MLNFFQKNYAQNKIQASFSLIDNNQAVKINTLYKAKDGYIFAGTTNGLYTFDGVKFEKINFVNSTIKDTVTAIFEDVDLTIWVGFKNGKIATLIHNKLQYLTIEEGFSKVPITAFLQDKQKNIWFATNGEGVYFFKNKHLYLFNETEGLSDTYVHALALAKNGDVLAATDQGLNICKLVGNKKIVEVIGQKNGLPDYYITTIAPLQNNTFLLGTQEKGYCIFDCNTKLITIPNASTNWKYGQINTLLPTQNNLWISTQENGLLKKSAITEIIAQENFSKDEKNINAIVQDDEGNIWSTCANKLSVSNANKIQLLPLYSNEMYETIHAIVSDNKNNIWTGTDGGIIKYTANDEYKTKQFYKIAGLTKSTDITGLYQDAYTNIWITTMGEGVFVLNPFNGAYRNINENVLLKNASILSVTGTDNTVCIGGLEGVATIFELTEKNKNISEKYSFINYNNIPNIGNNYIHIVYKDKQGRVWFGTDGKGITVLQNDKFITYNKKNGLEDEHIYSIVEDKKGRIWFNTKDAGIYSFENKKFKNYSLQDGISNLKINKLITDKFGNIVIVNETGVDILNPETGYISYQNSAQGINNINTGIGSVVNNKEGDVLLTTQQGIIVYSALNRTSQQPKTIINSIQLFLQTIDKDSSTFFKYYENGFTFNFTGLYYSNPSSVNYQYKLEGFNANWITTKDQRIYFPNLRPGKYNFKVRSALSNVFENASEANYSFTITLPFWKRYWFIALCTLLGAAILYWYIKLREAHVKKLQKLENEKIQFQFEVLRNQVNPHFLFNSFNTLISTIEDDPKVAVDYVEHLSNFFRNIVNYRDVDVITLKEEVKLLQTFYYLQHKRYGDSLKLKINIAEADQDAIYIAPLTLQLLLENAIKHNAVSKEAILLVELILEDKNNLLVRNNINSKISNEISTGMGLQNITQRYKILSKQAVKIHNDGKYFSVIIPTLKNL